MDMSQPPKIPKRDHHPDPVTLSAGRRRLFRLLRAANQMQQAASCARHTTVVQSSMQIQPTGSGKVLFRSRSRPEPSTVSPDWDSRADVFDFKL